MNRTPSEPAPGGSRGPLLALVLAVAASAVPLLALAGVEGLGFDAAWHVLIARQDRLGNLWAEIRNTAHPPVFFLALRAAIEAFGTRPFVYRLVGIAATLGSTWLVGRIVARTARHRWLPPAAALAFGTSLSVTAIGLDVRAYALATLFMLWACLAFIALAEQAFGEPRHRDRVVFALTAGLALLTHYGTALFLAGCFAAAAVPAAVDPEYRRRLLTDGRRHWRANLLALGAPAAVFGLVYAGHIVAWENRPFLHLPRFLFAPGGESVLAFLWRNTRAQFDLFVPPLTYQPIESTLQFERPELPGALVAGLVLAVLAAVAWLGFRPARGGEPGAAGAVGRRVPAIVLATMTALTIGLALLGRYPFGGRLRHQYFLFPFALIVLALLIDALARRSGRRLAGLLVALFALGGALNAANWLGRYQAPALNPLEIQMDRFHELFPAPEAIYVDQFSLIHFFRQHHHQPWRFVRRVRGHGPVDVWRVGAPGGEQFWVCYDTRQWQLDLSSRSTYRRMLQCLRGTGGRRLVVFRLQQRSNPPRWEVARTEAAAREEAAAVGLVPERMLVTRWRVWVAFRRR